MQLCVNAAPLTRGSRIASASVAHGSGPRTTTVGWTRAKQKGGRSAGRRRFSRRPDHPPSNPGPLERSGCFVRYRKALPALIEHAVHHIIDLTGGDVDLQEVGTIAHPGEPGRWRLQPDCRPTGVEVGRCQEQCGQTRADGPASIAPAGRITESRPSDPGVISAAMPELVPARWPWLGDLRRSRRRRPRGRPSRCCLRPTPPLWPARAGPVCRRCRSGALAFLPALATWPVGLRERQARQQQAQQGGNNDAFHHGRFSQFPCKVTRRPRVWRAGHASDVHCCSHHPAKQSLFSAPLTSGFLSPDPILPILLSDHPSSYFRARSIACWIMSRAASRSPQPTTFTHFPASRSL